MGTQHRSDHNTDCPPLNHLFLNNSTMPRQKCSQIELEDGLIEAVIIAKNEGQQINMAAYARAASMPYKTFVRRVNGSKPREDRDPVNRRLSKAQEGALIAWIDDMAQRKLFITRGMLRESANELIAPAPPVSAMWCSRWLKRHNRKLDVASAKPIERSRWLAKKEDVIKEWFSQFERLLREEGVDQANVWNMDETGFQIAQPGSIHVLVPKRNRKKVEIAAQGTRENVTCVEAVSAMGEFIPPYLIFRGAAIMFYWARANLPDDWALATSKKGFITSDLAKLWLGHFLEHTKKRRGRRTVLLIDGHMSHLTVDFARQCEANGIILFRFPPHLTHLMQPLDVGVFQPLKQAHSSAIIRAAWEGIDYGKIDFLSDLPAVRRKAMKRATIISAFRKAGIQPLNRDMVLNKVPSMQEMLQREEDEDLDRRVEEAAERAGEPQTPKKATDMAAQTSKLLLELRKLNRATVHVEKLLKGLNQAAIERDLVRTHNAALLEGQQKKTQRARQSGDKRQLKVAYRVTAVDLQRAIDARNMKKTQGGQTSQPLWPQQHVSQRVS